MQSFLPIFRMIKLKSPNLIPEQRFEHTTYAEAITKPIRYQMSYLGLDLRHH